MNSIIVSKPDGTTLRLTTQQVRALKRVYRRASANTHGLYPRFRDFVNLAQPTIGCDGMVAVPFAGMWLAIECDGYTHS